MCYLPLSGEYHQPGRVHYWRPERKINTGVRLLGGQHCLRGEDAADHRAPLMPMAHWKGRRAAGLCFLGASAVSSTAMKRSLVFHIYGLLCSILLLSPNATCLSLQRLDKRNIPEDNGEFNETVNANANILPPTPSTFDKEMNMSSVTSSGNAPAVPEESHNIMSLYSNSRVDNASLKTSTLEPNNDAGPTGQDKTLSDNGILTTAGSTTDYIPSMASWVAANEGNTSESNPQTEETNVNVKQSNLENSSLVNTIEMLTTNPRTSLVDTKTDYSTVSSRLDDQSLTTVNMEIPQELNPVVAVNKSNESAELIVSELGDDWDDTKVTMLPTNLGRSELTTAGLDHFMEEDVEAATIATSGMTVMSDDKSVFNVTEVPLVTDSKGSVSTDSFGPVVTNSIELNPELSDIMFIPQPEVEVNQSQDLSAATTGIEPLTADISDATVTAAIYVYVTSQDTTGESEVTEEGRDIVRDSATPLMEIGQNETNGAPSTTVNSQASEGVNPLSKEEEFLAGSVSPVAPMATTEAETTTILSTVTSVSHVSVDIPPTRRITTTASYGLDRLESEEGDEEDEDEEDEEDDETDEDEEEEEDENKDNDSVDESSEKDLDAPLFTLPGLSSQEPLENDANVALNEGAAFPVPDTMQWEQQNQGLVRSWMEKLKDKAGYMSGMLVPVGVGIAGALFILGVLYSIKMMNRRRRNGFKRHKRKQREFNSMQDRVMLLADSSEDEF